MVPIWFWRNMSGLAYGASIAAVGRRRFFGVCRHGGAALDRLGFMRLQPSELMKITLVMLLAAYYDWLPAKKISRPFWVFCAGDTDPVAHASGAAPTRSWHVNPAAVGRRRADVSGRGALGLFRRRSAAGIGLITAVFQLAGSEWQLLNNYQYRRIDTFLDPAQDPLGAGYHITQSKIALGSGGWTGRGFMQGHAITAELPARKTHRFHLYHSGRRIRVHRGVSLLGLYPADHRVLHRLGAGQPDRFSSLFILGIALNFFLFFAVNMSMVMGMAPVVGVPLPLVSYGGSAMLVLMIAFGLVQSAHVHRPR